MPTTVSAKMLSQTPIGQSGQDDCHANAHSKLWAEQTLLLSAFFLHLVKTLEEDASPWPFSVRLFMPKYLQSIFGHSMPYLQVEKFQ